MDATRTSPSLPDVAAEVNTFSAGLGIVTMALFPLAVPGLLLVIAPLLPLALVGGLLALPVILSRLLLRGLRRVRSRGHGAPVRSRTAAAAGRYG
jgi:hypothetical protein